MSTPDDDRCRHKPRSALPTTAGIILGLEPARAELHPVRRQPGKSPLEFSAAVAVACHQNHQIRKTARFAHRLQGLPATDALLQVPDGVDHQIEVLVGRPAGRTHDEPDGAVAADAEPHEERLPDLLALDAIDRHEHRRGPVVEHADAVQLEPLGEKPREPPRHAQMRIGRPRADHLQPASQTDSDVAAAEAERQDCVAEIVPVDHEPHPAQPRHDPGDLQGRKRGWILDQEQVRSRDLQEHSSETDARLQRINGREHSVDHLRPRDPEAHARVGQTMDGDARVVGQELGERRAFVPDQVHGGAAGGERVSVILHAGTPSQIPDDDNSNAHERERNRGYYTPNAFFRGSATGARR